MKALQVHYMCKLMVIHIEVKVITFWFLWSQKCDNPRPLAKSCITCKGICLSLGMVFGWHGFYVLQTGREALTCGVRLAKVVWGVSGIVLLLRHRDPSKYRAWQNPSGTHHGCGLGTCNSETERSRNVKCRHTCLQKLLGDWQSKKSN